MTDSAYAEYQGLLLPIARKLLDDPADAQDLVQDTLEKSLTTEDPSIRNPRAYLTRSLINRCLNFIRSRKRLEYSPVEIATEATDNIELTRVEDETDIKLAMLALMEKLGADERAVFLFAEAFDYSHREIAEWLGINETYSRQLLRRARLHLLQSRQRFHPDAEEVEELSRRFLKAGREAEIEPLREWLRRDRRLQPICPLPKMGHFSCKLAA